MDLRSLCHAMDLRLGSKLITLTLQKVTEVVHVQSTRKSTPNGGVKNQKPRVQTINTSGQNAWNQQIPAKLRLIRQSKGIVRTLLTKDWGWFKRNTVRNRIRLSTIIKMLIVMLTRGNRMFHRSGMLCLGTIMYQCAMLDHPTVLSYTGIAEDTVMARSTKTNLNLPLDTRNQSPITVTPKSFTMNSATQPTVPQRDTIMSMKLQLRCSLLLQRTRVEVARSPNCLHIGFNNQLKNFHARLFRVELLLKNNKIMLLWSMSVLPLVRPTKLITKMSLFRRTNTKQGWTTREQMINFQRLQSRSMLFMQSLK